MLIISMCCQQLTDCRLSITPLASSFVQHDDDWVWHSASRSSLVSLKLIW